MKAAEVKELNDADLLQSLADTKDDLFKMRFSLATGQQENTARIKAVRRDIARIETELRTREIRAAEALEASK
ncbi:MAG: ribosomal protein [Acidimicrobiia bacterium]|nr:ribosomal protein [Acidimicrobiia bacterium]